jgi:hypothetical protein
MTETSSEISQLSADEVRQLREVLDRAQILECLHRYCRGVDRADAELVHTVYHPGSTDDHGMLKMSGEEFANSPHRRSPDNVMSHHIMGQSKIEFDDKGAWVETYFIGHQRTRRPIGDVAAGRGDSDEARGDYLSIFVGRYIDRSLKIDGEWKIMHRTVVMDWAEESDSKQVHPLFDTFVQAARSPHDYVYAGRSRGPARSVTSRLHQMEDGDVEAVAE